MADLYRLVNTFTKVHFVPGMYQGLLGTEIQWKTKQTETPPCRNPRPSGVEGSLRRWPLARSLKELREGWARGHWVKRLPGKTVLVRIMKWEQGRKAGLGEVKGVTRITLLRGGGGG